MEELSNSIIANIVIITGIIAGYRAAFGAQQAEFTDVAIKLFNVRSRFKPAVNVATSIGVALCIGGVLALYSSWEVLPIAAIAGLYASTKAAQVHDEKKPAESGTTAVIRPLK